ncbi:MAG: imidazole glycerol phosphate synthase subunit HisH [Bacteroidetes bacterium]|nr:imidazole glycerol phosphate synthase subunit HisH [Bacteroidota bacterium]
MVVIIDYSVGNLGSVKNMFKRIGVNAVITGKADEIAKADKLILPGVGRFDYGMEQLNKLALVDIIKQKVEKDKTPILGICLGVQLLTEYSEEGNVVGLGFIKGKTVAFDKTKLQANQKIPHMGWTNVKEYSSSKLFKDMYDEPRFYFVHSYHLQIDNPEDIMVKANYSYDFAAGVECGNVLGVQFHPEKSHKYGMKLLENYINNY